MAVKINRPSDAFSAVLSPLIAFMAIFIYSEQI